MTDTQGADTPLIAVIDDDTGVRGSLSSLLRAHGYRVATFAAPGEFLAWSEASQVSSLILDVWLESVNGLDFQQHLLDDGILVPLIVISGHGDIPQTVRAMKAGAISFLAKPVDNEALLAAVAEAVTMDNARRQKSSGLVDLRHQYEKLTGREREIMALVTAGLMNKQIAARLSLSDITVKIYRGNLMRKMQAQSLADLVRMAEDLGARDLSAKRYQPQP